jgi:AcrR family transcriptional regulator
MESRGQASAAMRTRVLDAAVEVLAEVGADALTMQAVAGKADIALRTVYNHFPSKDDLIVQAYERLADATRAAVADAPAFEHAADHLEWFVRNFYECFERESPGAAAILGVTGIPAFASRMKDVRSWRRRELTAIMRAADAQGALRIPIKPAVALAFLTTAYATWHSLVVESGLNHASAKDTAVHMLRTTCFGETVA